MTEQAAAPQNGDRPRREPLPFMAYETLIPNASVNYVDRDDGGIELCFTAMQPIGPGQLALIPPRIRIMFDAGGWERFKREVAADGAQSGIVRAGSLPPA